MYKRIMCSRITHISKDGRTRTSSRRVEEKRIHCIRFIIDINTLTKLPENIPLIFRRISP